MNIKAKDQLGHIKGIVESQKRKKGAEVAEDAQDDGRFQLKNIHAQLLRYQIRFYW